MKQKPITKGNVFLLPTVIADDTLDKAITPHLKEVITNTEFFLVENVRTSRRFISSLKLGLVIENLDFQLLDKNSTSAELKELFKPVFQGHDIGILSESGCPGIADPGSLAVLFAHQQNIRVVPLVGPSSILMALMASGFNGQSFIFHGYVPIDAVEKESFIKDMEIQSAKKKLTQIFMDTPYRNEKLFRDLIASCQPTTLLSIAKDLTGKDEMIITQSIKQWKTEAPVLHKFPVIFCLYVE
ncbi:MAG: SAM-dependent methyltransferase [Bacteroidota bacterium]|nr:SAM-dependent methyltransferase [Bacteroidota bacterium]